MRRSLLLVLCLAPTLAHAQCQLGLSCNVSMPSSQTSSFTASSNDSTGSSNASSRGSNASSGISSGQSVNSPSTIIAVASAALVAVASGIITTVYVVRTQANAKVRADEFRKLHPPEPPRPAPQPIQLPENPTELSPPPLPPPGASLKEPGPTLDAMVLARSWLMANQLQLKQDLALGAGPALEDLASIAGIPAAHRAHFGRVLQRNRARFTAPAEVTPEQAAQCLSRVGALVMADPLLRADGEASLALQR